MKRRIKATVPELLIGAMLVGLFLPGVSHADHEPDYLRGLYIAQADWDQLSDDEKAALTAHLEACASCRSRAAGVRDIVAATSALQDDPWIEQALRARRAQALQGRSSSAPRGLGKQYIWGPAVAAALVLAVAGLNFQALFAPPAGTGSAPQVVAEAETANNAPDVYDDLDFYIWLSSQNEAANQDNRS